MQNSVLVPVDFTSVSQNAFKYAYHLASDLKASLHLLHVTPGPVALDPTVQLVMPEKTVSADPRDRIRAWVREIEGSENLPVSAPKISYHNAEGNIAREILRYAQQRDIGIIVAGTRDKHTLTDRWLGTVSIDLSQHATCPVLLVPAGRTYRFFKRVVIASDFHSNNTILLEQYFNFNAPFKAETHLVHVALGEDISYAYHEQQIKEILKAYAPPDQSYHMVTLQESDIMTALRNYGEATRTDLLVFIYQKRSIFKSWWHHSITKEAMLNCNIPTLIMHTPLE